MCNSRKLFNAFIKIACRQWYIKTFMFGHLSYTIFIYNCENV